MPLVDLSAQYRAIAAEVRASIDSVLAEQRFILGPEVGQLEQEISVYLDVSFTVGVASGTDALLLPLRALDLPPGSDVIVPSFTFFATAGAVWNAGFRPVFCDVDPGTFCMTAETLEAAWTPTTSAVIPVHMFGLMASMEEILPLAETRGAAVIEDAAQAFGSRSPAGTAGSLGDAGAFSFFPTKNLGGFGDGGLVTTTDAEVADRVAKLRVHGGKKMYHHEMVGTNSRLDELQAAVLRVKLRHLDAWTAARRRNAAFYEEHLAGISGVEIPETRPDYMHVYNQYTLKVDRRDELRQFLAEQGIGSGVYYPVPLHLQECFSVLGCPKGALPVSELLANEVLSIPVVPELNQSQLDHVVQAIRRFYT